MKLTKKENLFYSEKMKSLGINQRQVLNQFKLKKVSITILSDKIGFGYHAVFNNVKGYSFNPKIIIAIHQFLEGVKTPLDFSWCAKLTKEDKRLDNLLMNGFSYWEAVRIAQ